MLLQIFLKATLDNILLWITMLIKSSDKHGMLIKKQCLSLLSGRSIIENN